MSVHRQTLTLDAVSAYPGTAQVIIPFVPKTITVLNEGLTSAPALVSFDGVNDHAQLTPGTPSAGLVFRQGVQKVWFKRGAVASGIVVQVIAES